MDYSRIVDTGTLMVQVLKGLLKRFRKGDVNAVQLREERLSILNAKAEAEESKNVQLKERLAFKQKEKEVLNRVRTARAGRITLLETLRGYETQSRMTWKMWLLVVGAVLFLLTILGKC